MKSWLSTAVILGDAGSCVVAADAADAFGRVEGLWMRGGSVLMRRWGRRERRSAAYSGGRVVRGVFVRDGVGVVPLDSCSLVSRFRGGARVNSYSREA